MQFLTLEQFTEMWKLQDSLNTVTSGPDWRSKGQDWDLAIKAEVMEFFDYIGWKWWKDLSQGYGKPTDTQARLELVDIWHFILSAFMQYNPGPEIWSGLNKTLAECEHQETPQVKALMLLDSLKDSSLDRLIALTDAIHACEWSWEELYKAYIGKVALNNFRQANGYKEGTYRKDWQFDPEGTIYEDNFFLQRILESGHPVSYDNTMAGLQYYYDGEHLV